MFVLRVLLATAGFAAMALWAKQAYADGWAPEDLVAARFVLVALAFWTIVAARCASESLTGRVVLPPRRIALGAFALGLTAYALENHLYFAAVQRIDAGVLALIMSVYPALVVLMSRERLDPRRLIALTLALGGAVLVLAGGVGGAGFDTLGALLGLGSATAYATYLVMGGRLVRTLDPFVLAALVTSGAAVSLTIAAGGITMPAGDAAAFDLAGLVVFSSVLPLAWLWLGIAQIGAPTASIVASIEPVITVTLAALLLGEHLADMQLLGGAFVVGAVVVLNARVPRREPSPQVPAVASARALAHEPA
jgi:drug/metabolite transporter (DMT)-like permease